MCSNTSNLLHVVILTMKVSNNNYNDIRKYYKHFRKFFSLSHFNLRKTKLLLIKLWIPNIRLK